MKFISQILAKIISQYYQTKRSNSMSVSLNVERNLLTQETLSNDGSFDSSLPQPFMQTKEAWLMIKEIDILHRFIASHVFIT